MKLCESPPYVSNTITLLVSKTGLRYFRLLQSVHHQFLGDYLHFQISMQFPTKMLSFPSKWCIIQFICSVEFHGRVRSHTVKKRGFGTFVWHLTLVQCDLSPASVELRLNANETPFLKVERNLTGI